LRILMNFTQFHVVVISGVFAPAARLRWGTCCCWAFRLMLCEKKTKLTAVELVRPPNINTSTRQHVNTSTQHINTSTHQHINTSTHQHINTSTQNHTTMAKRPNNQLDAIGQCRMRKRRWYRQ
jgi:hypothetical protein